MTAHATAADPVAKLQAGLRLQVVPAMATPLAAPAEGGAEADAAAPARVDAEAVGPLVDFLVARGVGGLFVGGTTGQGFLLEAGERERLHEASVAAARGRVPVLLHVGANDTPTAVRLARHAAGLGDANRGVDGIVLITPTFYPLSDDALARHCARVAAAAPGLPFFAYDIPQQAVNGIGPGLLARLAKEVPTFAGVKSSRPDAAGVMRLLEAARDAGTVLLVGNEPLFLPMLASGAHGLISGLATAVPEPFVALAQAFARNDLEEARQRQAQVDALLAMLPAGARVAAIKQVLEARGVPVGPAVPPMEAPAAGSGGRRALWERMRRLVE